MAKAASISSNNDWQVEDDLRTLCKAKEIEKDPKRMAACQKMADKKMKEMASVTDNKMMNMDKVAGNKAGM